MEQVLIAGGTGFIGENLVQHLTQHGWIVNVLTRDKSKANNRGYFYWNPLKKEIDSKALEQTTVLINLAGSGIADKRWSDKRIHELHDSRIVPTDFLISSFKNSRQLKTVVQASGGTGYGYDKKTCYVESDPFGSDVIGELTKSWEAAALDFSQFSQLTMMRLGVVLGEGGGALSKLVGPIKWGLGSPLGSGSQLMPWVHVEDVARFCIWAVENKEKGIYNLAAASCSNEELTRAIGKALKRPIFMPKVPAFMLKLILGERAELLLESVCISNDKLKNRGFEFKHADLQSTLNTIFV